MIFKIFPCVVGDYRIKKTIKGRITYKSLGYTAWFEEADIEMEATTPNEALEAIKAQIVYTYDACIKNKKLGIDPSRKLEVLKNYIEAS